MIFAFMHEVKSMALFSSYERKSEMVFSPSSRGSYPSLKRFLDIAFALFFLLLFSPFFLLIAFGIVLTSRGPLFYKSQRVGKDGKLFTCLKFRTMYRDSEKIFQEVLKIPSFYEEWTAYHKLKKDPRLTRLGALLRKYSLDELPQFFNVLNGDLSLVGPRPISEEEFKEALFLTRHEYNLVLQIRPGITGLWQTSGRSTLSFEERTRLDIAYVKNMNLKMDLQLLLKTIPEVLFSRGAF